MEGNSYVDREVFAAKMETMNTKIDHLDSKVDGVRDELRTFKRTLTIIIVTLIPAVTAIAQVIVAIIGR